MKFDYTSLLYRDFGEGRIVVITDTIYGNPDISFFTSLIYWSCKKDAKDSINVGLLNFSNNNNQDVLSQISSLFIFDLNDCNVIDLKKYDLVYVSLDRNHYIQDDLAISLKEYVSYGGCLIIEFYPFVGYDDISDNNKIISVGHNFENFITLKNQGKSLFNGPNKGEINFKTILKGTIYDFFVSDNFNVYVSSGGPFLSCYDVRGDMIWRYQWLPSNFNVLDFDQEALSLFFQFVYFESLFVDINGNIYSCIKFHNLPSTFDFSPQVVSLDKSGKLRWFFDLGNRVVKSNICINISGGCVFVFGDDTNHFITCINNEGKEQWIVQVNSTSSSYYCSNAEEYVCLCSDNTLDMYDIDNGVRITPAFSFNGNIVSPKPISIDVSSKKIYLTTDNGIFVFNFDLSLIKSIYLGLCARPVAVEDDFLYVAISEPYGIWSVCNYFLNSNGDIKWFLPLNSVDSDILLDYSFHLFCCSDNVIYSVNKNDGSVIWSFVFDNNSSSKLYLFQDALYLLRYGIEEDTNDLYVFKSKFQTLNLLKYIDLLIYTQFDFNNVEEFYWTSEGRKMPFFDISFRPSFNVGIDVDSVNPPWVILTTTKELYVLDEDSDFETNIVLNSSASSDLVFVLSVSMQKGVVFVSENN